MTIELWTGTPGSGKSYDACRLIRRYLKRGDGVIANFRVNRDESWKGRFAYLANSELTPDNIIAACDQYWSVQPFEENGLLLVVDEAQLLWNSRLWAKDPHRMEFLQLMSQSRKYGLRVILVCQADIMIDRQFRSLVEYEVHHRKVASIGSAGKLLDLFSFGGLFYANKTYYGLKVKVDGYFFRYRKKIAQMYDSYTTFKQLSEAPQGA